MSCRQVELAVGFADQTWRSVWVSVPEDPDHVLDEDEVVEAARKELLDLAQRSKWQVSFIHVLFIEPLDNSLEDRY